MLSTISGNHRAGSFTPGIIIPKPAKPTDALLLYDFNYGSYPGSGQTIYDLAGNSYNTIMGSLNFVYSIGTPNTMQYTGTGGFDRGTATVAAGPASITAVSTITFSLWYKPTNSNGAILFNYLTQTGFYGIILSAAPNGFGYQINWLDGSATISSITSAGAITVNQWNLLSVIVAPFGGTTRFYVNGVEIGTLIMTKQQPASAMATGLVTEFGRAAAAQWNDFEIFGGLGASYNPAIKFADERAYYGV
jgi:hypothetical protein